MIRASWTRSFLLIRSASLPQIGVVDGGREQGRGDDPGVGGLAAVQVGDDRRQRVRHDGRGQDRHEQAEQQPGQRFQDLPVRHVDGGRPGGRCRLGHRASASAWVLKRVASGNRRLGCLEQQPDVAWVLFPAGPKARHDRSSLNRCSSRANSSTSRFGQLSMVRRICPSRAARAASNRRVPSSVRLSCAARRSSGSGSRRTRPSASRQWICLLSVALADAEPDGQVGQPGRAGATQPEQQAVRVRLQVRMHLAGDLPGQRPAPAQQRGQLVLHRAQRSPAGAPPRR